MLVMGNAAQQVHILIQKDIAKEIVLQVGIQHLLTIQQPPLLLQAVVVQEVVEIIV